MWGCTLVELRRVRVTGATLLVDVNDFDETLPGPFEYDVKRMAASFTVAARNNVFAKSDTRAATLASVRAYREAMAQFADMRTLDVWYARLSEADLLQAIKKRVSGQNKAGKAAAGKAEKAVAKGAAEGSHPRTACRHSRSSARWSMGSTGSSASRRSSCRCVTVAPGRPLGSTTSRARSTTSSA